MSEEVTESRSLVLEPVDRASEIIFGVLMAMTFTGTLSVATAGRQEIDTMLWAALGCNLGWGLVDAVMYLVDNKVEMDRKINLLRQLHATDDSGQADDLILAALPDRIAAGASPAALEAMRKRFLSVPVPATALGPRDYLGALGVLGLVVLATFPVVIPFVLFSEVALAMRLSNLLAICTVFIAGYTLGRSAGGVYPGTTAWPSRRSAPRWWRSLSSWVVETNTATRGGCIPWACTDQSHP